MNALVKKPLGIFEVEDVITEYGAALLGLPESTQTVCALHILAYRVSDQSLFEETRLAESLSEQGVDVYHIDQIINLEHQMVEEA